MEPLADHECAYVIGAHNFSKVSGLGARMAFEGPISITDTKRSKPWFDLYGRRATALGFIDPLECSDIAEFGMETMAREVVKAHSAFSVNAVTLGEHYPYIATGNWGGGAAGGDPTLRFVMQWVAAAYSGRKLEYYIDDSNEQYIELFEEIVATAVEKEITAAIIVKYVSNYTEHRREYTLGESLLVRMGVEDG
eukprot:CAMPEP_0170183878 /NCGR_PEP_ID=MMETSP0040_2-20121228/32049_1 /TAXON_ID=641309 /ORGANISM="Lotharella oceanica, Strain CCMP622" /LENGTH=193 /DNA_ID=CAMNT_0010429749 /DNA_START=111 /DNA_END=692 /DNA_ORIENTATION=-